MWGAAVTLEEYKTYFADILKADAVEIQNMDQHITRAIQQGLADLWGASNWMFKQTETTLTVADTDPVDLPDDFEGFRTLREKGSNRGWRLTYMPREEFDRVYPKATALPSGTLKIFTVYRDMSDNGKWKALFLPSPSSSTTVYMLYYIGAGEVTVNLIPSKAQAALEAFIAKHAYPYNHPGRVMATQVAEIELKKLQTQDKADMSSMHFFPDETYGPEREGWSWTD